MDDLPAIMLVLGANLVQAGFAGDDSPRSVFPNVVASLRDRLRSSVALATNKFVGDEAMTNRGVLTLRRTMHQGTAVSWDDVERILHYIFYNELRVAPEETPILVEDHGVPGFRAAVAKLLFETYNVPAVQFETPGILAVRSAGRNTGISVHVGATMTTITPVYNWCLLRQATVRVPLSGDSVTSALIAALEARGDVALDADDASSAWCIAEDIAEKLCYCAPEPLSSEATAEEKVYELLDGRSLTLSKELHESTEVLFDPAGGIGRAVYDAIMACDVDLRRDLYANIIIFGGGTMYKGFPDRLRGEVSKLAPPSVKIQVIADTARKYSVWIGGSILSSLSTFQQCWISKQEYEEDPMVVETRARSNYAEYFLYQKAQSKFPSTHGADVGTSTLTAAPTRSTKGFSPSLRRSGRAPRPRRPLAIRADSLRPLPPAALAPSATSPRGTPSTPPRKTPSSVSKRLSFDLQLWASRSEYDADPAVQLSRDLGSNGRSELPVVPAPLPAPPPSPHVAALLIPLGAKDVQASPPAADRSVVRRTSDDDEVAAIMLKLGAATIHGGFAGDDAPRVVFSSKVGYPRDSHGGAAKKVYLADEVEKNRAELTLRRTMHQGTAVSWDDVERILHYIFYNELRVAPEETPILVEDHGVPGFRAAVAKLLFETYNVPAVQFETPGILAVRSAGRNTGISVHVGATMTTITPVYNWCLLRQATVRVPLSGDSVTSALIAALEARGDVALDADDASSAWCIAEDIAEKLCYCAPEPLSSEATAEEKVYELLDGRSLTLSKELHESTEVLFDPAGGIGRAVYDAIMACDVDLRRDLYANIIIFGGGTMYKGFPDRLRGEVSKLAPPSVKIQVIADTARKYSVWIGGSILSSLSTFQQCWISKQEYEEDPMVVESGTKILTNWTFTSLPTLHCYQQWVRAAVALRLNDMPLAKGAIQATLAALTFDEAQSQHRKRLAIEQRRRPMEAALALASVRQLQVIGHGDVTMDRTCMT